MSTKRRGPAQESLDRGAAGAQPGNASFEASLRRLTEVVEKLEGGELGLEESLRLFRDVGGRTFVAIHWGTFDLSEEPIDEPPRRLAAAARAQGLPDARVWILAHGETRAW